MGILIQKNIARYSLLLKIEGIAVKLTITDKAVEINGVAQRNFLLKQKTIDTDKTGITPNTDIFHQSILSLHSDLKIHSYSSNSIRNIKSNWDLI